MISDNDVAELYETLGRPGAAHFRATADESASVKLDELRGVDDAAAQARTLLDSVKDTSNAKTKHGGDCWQRHAACLADKIREVIG